MDKKEAIEEFNDTSKSLAEKYKKVFQENLNNNIKDFNKCLLDGIRAVVCKVQKVQEVNEDYRLYRLQFEFLRSNVLSDNYKIYISGYNESLYLDEMSISKEIDLKFLFEPLISLKNELNFSIKKYLGKITKYDVLSVVMDTALEWYKDMVCYARDCMWNIDEFEWLNENVMGKYYFIKWCEYQSIGETIFAMDFRHKEKEEFLELSKYPEEKMRYVYTVWNNANFDTCDVSNKNMAFINFKRSKLTNIDFSNNNLLCSQFEKSYFSKCSFKDSKCIGCSFKSSTIRESNFENATLRKVNFENSSFRDINFNNADLSNSVFIGCSFKNVSFENSILDNAVFSEKDIAYLHLSPQQLQKIYIWRQ